MADGCSAAEAALLTELRALEAEADVLHSRLCESESQAQTRSAADARRLAQLSGALALAASKCEDDAQTLARETALRERLEAAQQDTEKRHETELTKRLEAAAHEAAQALAHANRQTEEARAEAAKARSRAAELEQLLADSTFMNPSSCGTHQEYNCSCGVSQTMPEGLDDIPQACVAAFAANEAATREQVQSLVALAHERDVSAAARVALARAHAFLMLALTCHQSRRVALHLCLQRWHGAARAIAAETTMARTMSQFEESQARLAALVLSKKQRALKVQAEKEAANVAAEQQRAALTRKAEVETERRLALQTELKSVCAQRDAARRELEAAQGMVNDYHKVVESAQREAVEARAHATKLEVRATAAAAAAESESTRVAQVVSAAESVREALESRGSALLAAAERETERLRNEVNRQVRLVCAAEEAQLEHERSRTNAVAEARELRQSVKDLKLQAEHEAKRAEAAERALTSAKEAERAANQAASEAIANAQRATAAAAAEEQRWRRLVEAATTVVTPSSHLYGQRSELCGCLPHDSGDVQTSCVP